MPELPEVETIVQQLKKKVLGRKILNIKIKDHLIGHKSLLRSKDQTILSVFRRGKYILIELDKGDYLMFHLRMTGFFKYFNSRENIDQRFLAVIFYLDDGSMLTFNCIRRFSIAKLLNKKELDQEVSKLGVEPLSKEFTTELFLQMLANKPTSNIKVFLMDQHFIAGIGNIYAQEVLYYAKVSPLRKTGSLSAAEKKEIYIGIKEILKLAIEKKGSTVDNYSHVEGSGEFQKYLAVYGQEKCPKKHPITKIVLGGRGTSYCSVCQR